MRLRSSRLGVALLAITFSLISWSPSAVAAPSPSPSAQANQNKTIQEFTKKELAALYQAMQNYEIKMHLINDDFKFAIDKAFLDARYEMKSAITPEQKNLVNSHRKLAITAAITARENAIDLLGPAPTPPLGFKGFKGFKGFMGFGKDGKPLPKQTENSKRS